NEEIGRNAARIVPVAPPVQEPIEIERALGRGAEERVPVQVLARSNIRVRLIADPEIAFVIAGVIYLGLHDATELAFLDVLLRGLVRVVAHTLHAYLHFDFGQLNLFDDLLRLLDRPGHRLLAVDMLAGVRSV